MKKRLIPKHGTLPVYHCVDGIDTVVCFSFLNEGFEEFHILILNVINKNEV